jgi:hypothetical protein
MDSVADVAPIKEIFDIEMEKIQPYLETYLTV